MRQNPTKSRNLSARVPVAAALVGFGLAASCGKGIEVGQPSTQTCPTAPCALSSALPRQMLATLVPEAADQVAGNNAFAMALYRRLRQEQATANLVVSPYSLSSALAMTYAGARGATASQMATAMDFRLPQASLHRAFNALDQELGRRASIAEPTEGDTFQLKVANALWGARGSTFSPEFLDVLAVNYGAGMRLLDFEQNTELARQTINGWVDEQTAGKIKDLVPAGFLTPSTALVLTNAIYFKASWASAFRPGNTADRAFHLSDGQTIMVPTMQQDFPFGMVETPAFQAVTLPFVGDQVSMLVVAPRAGMFATVEATLDPAALADMIDQQVRTAVLIRLPKFKFGSRFMLVPVLSQLGMPVAFTAGADFSGITPLDPLMISDVLHNAVVGVDEKGAEAAAATAVITLPPSASSAEVELNIDRPFLFFLRDRPTGAILFVGSVLDPR